MGFFLVCINFSYVVYPKPLTKPQIYSNSNIHLYKFVWGSIGFDGVVFFGGLYKWNLCIQEENDKNKPTHYAYLMSIMNIQYEYNTQNIIKTDQLATTLKIPCAAAAWN